MKYAIDGDILLYSLAKVDTEGEGMVAEKLSYILYYEDAEGMEYSRDIIHDVMDIVSLNGSTSGPDGDNGGCRSEVGSRLQSRHEG